MSDNFFTRRGFLIGSLAIGKAIPPFSQASAAENFGDALDALLARYIHIGDDGINRVAYGAWKSVAADIAALTVAIERAAAVSPSGLTAEAAFAYWTNLYNALTLKTVLDHYPVGSIRDIKSSGVIFDLKAFAGPWRTRLVNVEGRRLSLDDIEHEIMRPTFRDPRVHYAVNCASIGCPNLKPTAWRADTLLTDLDAAAAAYINHPRGAADLGGGRLAVSSIYRWYRKDFGGSDKGVLAHLQNHANDELAAAIKSGGRIVDHRYDWKLNDRR
ncbi:MAG: DUF547 domain-containing protein [Rhizobiaceae bacterium]